MNNYKKEQMKFRIGGIGECLFLAVVLSYGYLILNAITGWNLPLFNSDISEVFTTLFLLIPINFFGLSALEIFWFERNLDWSGRKKK